MQHQEVEPPEELRDTIKDFWHISRDFGERPTSFEVTPDGYAEIIFYFGSPCSMSTTDGLQLLPSPFLVGLLNQPVLFYAQNRLEIIGIKCFPWAVFELLDLPSSKGGVRIFEHPIAQLQATLATCIQVGNIAEALTQVMQYFRQARSQMVTDRLLGKAGGAMRAANGTLPVSQVATAAHATVRTLERKFKQAAGYTVKDVSGLMRFEQARNHLWLDPTANLASLAQELGYTDQSHLGREFKRYNGTTPAAFARKARRWQQTVSTDFVAFILS
ncbi:helix-turn-helix domain-containing protein [Hymenobacter sp. GOD-10R]|uniref:helix-turn-helix domain-containing protein n=1 Tax=Hymenobacter sp. GOD-10R TaxID=3093922 RepID=UPI002D79BC8F|nr:helix-turn-helix domain-containing protein [Hymenobacter sp. GOD-10R]WRQ30296.1 helix-turn-helix domain-containing protein [Hymenobacter sp. GOD-10R]